MGTLARSGLDAILERCEADKASATQRLPTGEVVRTADIVAEWQFLLRCLEQPHLSREEVEWQALLEKPETAYQAQHYRPT